MSYISGGSCRAVLVVFVVVVDGHEKPLRLPMFFLLHVNHYLKVHFNENPRRLFFSRLFAERGGELHLRGAL